jgi:hypothetical protein
MSENRKGVPKPEASRINYSLAAKKRWNDAASREKLSSALIGHSVSNETRVKIGNARKHIIQNGWVHPCTGKKHSEDRRRKNSEALLRLYASGYIHPRKGKKGQWKTKNEP